MREAAHGTGEDTFMRHDRRLHDLILEWAGNQRSRAIVAGLRETTRLLGASTAERTRTIADIDDEHSPVVEAILAGNPAAAEAAMRAHLVNTGRLLVAQALRDELGPGAAEPDVEAAVEQIWASAVD
jgi:DNA-binding GntR family transcriptional regulator